MSVEDVSASRRNKFVQVVVGSALLLTFPVALEASGARAQQTASVTVSVPAGSLESGLLALGRQANLKMLYASALTSGKQTGGVNGQLTSQSAVAQLLAGTGLSYSFSGTNTVRIFDPASGGNDATATLPGAVALDTIDVGGGGAEGGTEYTPYETAAPVAHISRETIERFRGSSPADIFRGTPGVMSGEARNGAGSIDVNIRGMQGMGRVATTVDGAENSLQIYQGYQGLSSRTFVDPDLIASVDITKGSDAASRGIAGTVAMRTLDAGDIVKPGQKWGARIKGELGGNTSTPDPGAKGGYSWPGGYWLPAITTPSPDGLDRPSFLEPTRGSGSAVAAVSEENYDLLAGYAYRKQGNYHAGENGPSARPVSVGPRTLCNVYNYCEYWPDFIENAGITNYRAGEEVLNTQLETESWLAKGTLRFGDGHSLKFGYTGFRSEAGDRLASQFTSERGQPIQQLQTSGTVLDTGTLRYRWNPADNDLVDLKANFWVTDLELRNPPRNAYGTKPASIGLSKYYRTGSDTVMWGGDATNTSRFSSETYGSLDLTYGLSYVNEDTRPSAYTGVIEGWLNLRDAEREEAGAFSKVAYKPVDWLTLNGGLRYSHFWSNDRSTSDNPAYINPDPQRDEGGFSPSAGLTLEPIKGTQLYVNYSNALRYPSLFESASAFTIIPNPDLRPERASNWEAGVNVQQDGILTASDKAMLKFGYFNWDVSDYIAREFKPFAGDGYTWWGMQVYNIDRAKFSGLEFSGRYETGGFTADLAANYYLNVEFCRTAGTCAESSLYGDYATNHVPPEYSIDLTLSQKLFDDALTVGGRVSHVGPRAIEHGLVTAQGLSQFISQINWEPYTLVDLFADYRINDTWTVGARIENVTDQYYVDPLGLVNQPGPGRTFYASLTSTLGGEESLPRLSYGNGDEVAKDVDWTGLYAGFHGGWSFGAIDGITTALDGATDPISTTESADVRFDSPLFGVQAGFNWQFPNRVVAGIEADYSRSWLDKAQAAYTKEEWVAPINDVAGIHAENRYDIDWMASVRGRLGYAFDDGLMLYGTAGVAFLEEAQFRDQYRYDSNDQRTELFFVDKLTTTHTGFTIGGGAEYAINDRWSIKADYSYSQFRPDTAKFKKARAGTGTDYQTREQIGTETHPPNITPDDPNLGWICVIAPEACQPYEVPVYEYTNHEGTSSIINGRKASNELDFHSFTIGFNYRF